MRQSSRSPLNWGVFVFEGAGDASRCDPTGFGTEAVLRLWRIAIFRTGFPWLWIDGDVFSWKVTARLAPRGIAISARKLAQMRADF